LQQHVVGSTLPCAMSMVCVVPAAVKIRDAPANFVLLLAQPPINGHGR